MSEMRLIGAGLPRTATLTQKTALEMLGAGPCYHMVNVLADLDQVAPWMAALEGKGQWDEIFAGFQSTVDWPGGYFYKELMEVYPDAVVLLSVRDPQAWARSAHNTVWSVRHGESLMRLLSSAWGKVDPKWQGFLEMVDGLLWKDTGTFAAAHETEAQLAAGMVAFNEEVKRTVPAERLVVWEPKDGWEPLCTALDVPVPGEPLPHVNDSEEFVARIIDSALEGLQAWQRERVAAA
jgi:Sulfotransferase domain